MNKFLTDYLKYIILAVIIYMPLFGHLDSLPIRLWDEARLAMNAFEMYKNNNFLVTHYGGEPDMWNTKPPLLIWLQVAFMKVIGLNELSIRLPSAIAALLTCITLMIFSLRYLNSFWFGFIAILVLITSNGYINIHASRTGDYDSLLTLFTTLSALYFFLFCESGKYKQLYLFFIFTALAVLTKSIAGLFFIPAIFIYSLLQKQVIPLLKSKHFYLGFLIFFVLVAGYYLIREANNSGYLAAVQKNELGGRYLDVIEDHKQGFWYYYDNLIATQFSAWYLLVPCGILIGAVIKNSNLRKITLLSSLIVSTYFLVISQAQTKLEWYTVPLFPFLAILVTVFIYYIFDLLMNLKWLNRTLKYNVVPTLFLFLICVGPYHETIGRTYLPKEQPWDKDVYDASYYLQGALKGEYDLRGQNLMYDGYNPHNLFYLGILNAKGINVGLRDWGKLESGDICFAYQNNIKQYVEQHYIYDVINTNGNILTYKINGKKQ